MKRLLLILLTFPLVSIAMKDQHTPKKSNSKKLNAVNGPTNSFKQKLKNKKKEADTRHLDAATALEFLYLALLQPETDADKELKSLSKN